MQIAPGVHHFDTGPFNWYVLEEGGRLTVVDSGFPGHYGVFVAGMRSLGYSPLDVDAIVLTHSHADHTGFASRLARESKAPVYIHRDDLDSAGRVLELPWWGLLSSAWRPFVAGVLAHATWNGVFTMPTVRRGKPLEDGQTLNAPGRPRVIHVPGHTPGQIVLHVPERGILFSSDAIVTQDLMSGARGTPGIPSRLLNADDRQTRRSLDRLADLGRVTLLTGHGPAWTGEIREAIELARSAGRAGRGRMPLPRTA